MSEAMLAMVLDIEVDRHKREVAEGFAALKAKLPPEPKTIEHDPFHNMGMSSGQLADFYSDLTKNWLVEQSNLAHIGPYALMQSSGAGGVFGGLFIPAGGRWF